MLGEETDMTVYDNIDDETNEFDQNDESEQPDEVVDIQEDEGPGSCLIICIEVVLVVIAVSSGIFPLQ